MHGVPASGQGWLRDIPDFRDFDPSTPTVREAMARLKRRRSRQSAPPPTIDLSEFLPEPLPSSSQRQTTARGIAALVQTFERRATGRVLDLSPEFLDYAAQRLEERPADGGVSLRAMLKALARFGCPPRRFGPNVDTADGVGEPSTLAFGYQRDFAGLQYFRLDPPGVSGAEVLKRVKGFLAAGFPLVCGSALPGAPATDGDLAYPTKHDAIGLATSLVVVGYDDRRRIRSSHGALTVQTSLGPNFGEAGRARLPYRFIESGLACDFWTLLKPDWIATGEFEQPVA